MEINKSKLYVVNDYLYSRVDSGYLLINSKVVRLSKRLIINQINWCSIYRFFKIEIKSDIISIYFGESKLSNKLEIITY